MGCGCNKGGQRNAMNRGNRRSVVGPKRSTRNRQLPASAVRRRAIQAQLSKTGNVVQQKKIKKLRQQAIMRALGKN
jgi:hypothetical protein